MKVKLENGRIINLGENEVLEDRKCSKCGGQLVTNYGAGISCTFCLNCGDNDYDYDF